MATEDKIEVEPPEPPASAEPTPDPAGRKRNIVLETAVVAAVTSVLATVVQKLLFGDSSIAISVALTVAMEVVYFLTIGKRPSKA